MAGLVAGPKETHGLATNLEETEFGRDPDPKLGNVSPHMIYFFFWLLLIFEFFI